MFCCAASLWLLAFTHVRGSAVELLAVLDGESGGTVLVGLEPLEQSASRW
jgi:hypothetical protein